MLFVKHHIEQYNGIFPIWVISELFTFGVLSRFYADMPLEDQKYLAKSEYCTTPGNIRSWLRCCSDLRNTRKLVFRAFITFPTSTGTAKRKTLPLRPCGRISGSFPGMKYIA